MKSNFLSCLIVSSIICLIIFCFIFTTFAIILKYNSNTYTGYSLNNTNVLVKPLMKLSFIDAIFETDSTENEINNSDVICGKPFYSSNLKVKRIISGTQAVPHRFVIERFN